MDPILDVRHLRKQFSGQQAVDDISFTVSRGSIFGLLGPNGAGKTTLLRMITGIFLPDAGEIRFGGGAFDPLRDVRRIGYMPEERGLYKKMRIGEQALYLARLKGLSRDDAQRRAREWFGRLGMDTWWNKKVEELSKGMSQKLQFVTTVMHDPELIILDEPFSGLDPVNANLIKDEIFRLAEAGHTIVFSTHRMEQVEEICEHIILVDRGRKILDGAVGAVRRQYREGLYRIAFDREPETAHWTSTAFERTGGQGRELVLRLTPGAGSNEILSHFIGQGLVIEAFQEVLPSLNDIFIRLVEGAPAARAFQPAP
jgi:ABC-2 type transport system ATP-binding protein